MERFSVESIEIPAPAQKVFDYVADASRLPEWTLAFKNVRDGRATMQTPAGAVDIGLTVRAAPQTGTIDWLMTFPDGTAAKAWSRVVPADDGGSIFSFILPAPPLPLEQLEGTLDQQTAALRQELQHLRDVLTRQS